MHDRNSTARGGLVRAAMALRRGDAAAAAEQCRRLLRRDAGNIEVLDVLYQAQLAVGDWDAARFSLERLIRLAPRETGYYRRLAALHKQQRRFDAAHSTLDQAMGIAPGDCAVRAAKAELHYLQRAYSDAAAILEPCLREQPAHPAVAQAYARLAPRLDAREQAVVLVRGSLARAKTGPTRSRLLFELGNLLDGLERYDEAFEAYDEANSLKVDHADPALYRQAVERMMESWKGATWGLDEPESGARVLFIVGMPRSGTSLVEQILASHPAVCGGGERTDIEEIVQDIIAGDAWTPNLLLSPRALTPEVVRSMRARYGGQVARARGGQDLLTDKAPFNFLHLGVIEQICPRARVIHCVRDARDTCLSIYFNNLVGMHVPPADLAGIGERYRLYERVMAHWRGALSLPTLDVRYEELVRDPESGARRMLEFAGLPWDDAVLRYHESRLFTLTSSADQVRRPLYNPSIGRWNRYERHLGELLGALADRS